MGLEKAVWTSLEGPQMPRSGGGKGSRDASEARYGQAETKLTGRLCTGWNPSRGSLGPGQTPSSHLILIISQRASVVRKGDGGSVCPRSCSSEVLGVGSKFSQSDSRIHEDRELSR